MLSGRVLGRLERESGGEARTAPPSPPGHRRVLAPSPPAPRRCVRTGDERPAIPPPPLSGRGRDRASCRRSVDASAGRPPRRSASRRSMPHRSAPGRRRFGEVGTGGSVAVARTDPPERRSPVRAPMPAASSPAPARRADRSAVGRPAFPDGRGSAGSFPLRLNVSMPALSASSSTISIRPMRHIAARSTIVRRADVTGSPKRRSMSSAARSEIWCTRMPASRCHPLWGTVTTVGPCAATVESRWMRAAVSNDRTLPGPTARWAIQRRCATVSGDPATTYTPGRTARRRPLRTRRCTAPSFSPRPSSCGRLMTPPCRAANRIHPWSSIMALKLTEMQCNVKYVVNSTRRHAETGRDFVESGRRRG